MRKFNRLTIKQKKEKAWQFMLSYTFRVGLLIFVCALGSMYVAYMSLASTKGYKLSELQREITELKQENARLTYEISSHRSMVSIEERLEEMTFVARGEAEFERYIPSEFALND